MFSSLYFSEKSFSSLFNIKPSGLLDSLMEYSPKGISFDIPLPFSLVIIVSTTIPFLYITVLSLAGSKMSSLAMISNSAFANPFS